MGSDSGAIQGDSGEGRIYRKPYLEIWKMAAAFDIPATTLAQMIVGSHILFLKGQDREGIQTFEGAVKKGKIRWAVSMRRSPYLRSILMGSVLIGDRGFDGLKLPGVEVMTVGRGKGKASQRQYVETVLSVVGKAMYLPWKKGITAQAYIHAKAIAFNRKTKFLALQQAI